MDLINFFVNCKYSNNLVNDPAHSFINDNRIGGTMVNGDPTPSEVNGGLECGINSSHIAMMVDHVIPGWPKRIPLKDS